jgi:hypothetical protein
MNLRGRDGVRIHFEMKTKPVLSDANALLDLTLEQLDVVVRFTPATPGGPREADLIASLQLQGADSLPGRSLGATGLTLDIAGEHFWVRLPLAELVGGPLVFDVAHGRIGELTFRAGQAFIGMDETGPLLSLTEGMPL